MKIDKLSSTLTLIATCSFAQLSTAAELDIEITNLTQGLHFTPLLVAAHGDADHMYQLGMAASDELQMMAEGGDISGLSGLLTSADKAENPAAGLLAPGMSTLTMLSTDAANTQLSIVSMLLPTNDGFVGLDSWTIPTEAGSYTIYLNGYDAGTEANDEIINGGGAPGAPGIPADPSGNNGTGATGVTDMEMTQVVHVHRGALGDTDVSGGSSDLNSTVHRWLNPVAKVTVTVK